MKLFSVIALLSVGAVAESVVKCLNCHNAPNSDCVAAYNKMPTSGTLSGQDNQIWTSGSCSLRWWPNGVSANAASVHGDAQAMINDCCMGSGDCSGTSYDTGSSDEMNGGCLCLGDSKKISCNCAFGHTGASAC